MTKFIAEISSNHNNNRKRIKKLIELCSEAGFFAVKFQLFKIDKLFSKEILEKSKTHRSRKKWELKPEMIDEIISICKKNKIKVGFTPFDEESLDLIKNKCDFFKISSYDILRNDFISKILNYRKLTLISTGMSSRLELSNLNKLLKKNLNNNTVIMHCRSLYPCDPTYAHLNFIKYLKKKFNTKIGWSDHTNNKYVILEAAMTIQSDYIELHVDLDDKKGFEGNVGHCYKISEVKEIIDHLDTRKKILGDQKFKSLIKEKKEILWRADPIDGLRPLIAQRKKLI